MSEPPATTARDEAVAEVLERLRAGVRQRQAELACLDLERGDLPASLAAVKRDGVLEEPSFRIEGASALRTLIERAFYILFARRQHRALLRQQNRFNRSVELALGDLHARQEALRLELRQALERSAELEGEKPAGAAAPRALGRGAGTA
jgi:hypothetical protein